MYVFIINPISGNGKGELVWKRVEKILIDKQTNYKAYYTKDKEHVTEIVKTLDPEIVTACVVIGGDGTVHDVVNGLQSVKIPLGIIPAGTGNDYARSMKIPKGYQLALERILSGEKKKIDILHVGERVCMTVIGIGFDGKVAQLANESKSKKILNGLRLGKFTYLLIVLQLLFKYKPTQVRLELDDVTYEFENVWLIAVANLPYYGGGMYICPQAVSDDGAFDVCIVHHTSKMKLMQVFPKVFRGKHINHSSVTVLKGKTIKVISDIPVVIHGDGEIIGETPVEVTVKKDVLDII
ncbi:diacylglycerol/lipid kinase family protein [Alkalihalobacterium alkalinitrilicum]|uniref:diacylglycerol/lipid kinase family protein n=1 Tax=Alkalihalobacterium alkalinitrilicum TaxID=427920 RepID=UPI000994C105|nr:diacylglycerol kinase family protein [Alkalihalobacterium alkalinitrilicum]